MKWWLLLMVLSGCAMQPVSKDATCWDLNLSYAECEAGISQSLEARYQREKEAYEEQQRQERVWRAMGGAAASSLQDFGNTLRGRTTTCTTLGGFIQCHTR